MSIALSAEPPEAKILANPYLVGKPHLFHICDMKSMRVLPLTPSLQFFPCRPKLASKVNWVSHLRHSGARFPASMATNSTDGSPFAATTFSPPIVSAVVNFSPGMLQNLEERIEKVIYGCRFLAILAVWGSLIGSFLCFIKGCTYVMTSFQEYFMNRGKVILLLVEAVDVYLLGTVMLVFGMGLYELFISNLDIAKSLSEERIPHRSNLFGLFTLKERPRWLEIKSVNELKTKLGHVIVMVLLMGFFEKCKTTAIESPVDLLCFSASVLLASGSLYLLSKLNGRS